MPSPPSPHFLIESNETFASANTTFLLVPNPGPGRRIVFLNVHGRGRGGTGISLELRVRDNPGTTQDYAHQNGKTGVGAGEVIFEGPFAMSPDQGARIDITGIDPSDLTSVGIQASWYVDCHV